MCQRRAEFEHHPGQREATQYIDPQGTGQQDGGHEVPAAGDDLVDEGETHQPIPRKPLQRRRRYAQDFARDDHSRRGLATMPSGRPLPFDPFDSRAGSIRAPWPMPPRANSPSSMSSSGSTMRGSGTRSEEPTSELQSLMRISYAVFCLQK